MHYIMGIFAAQRNPVPVVSEVVYQFQSFFESVKVKRNYGEWEKMYSVKWL